MLVVYFSSATRNTERFVEKLDLPSKRIPLHKTEPPLVVDEPYVLICPTYGGGASISGATNTKPVPPQVIRFLNNPHNRNLIRAVIASGNSNFGSEKPETSSLRNVTSLTCIVSNSWDYPKTPKRFALGSSTMRNN